MMERTFRMDGFRAWLECAVRVDKELGTPGEDWSEHTVKYNKFKKRLKFYARRRLHIRAMFRQNKDLSISELALRDILGPKKQSHSSAASTASLPQPLTRMPTTTLDHAQTLSQSRTRSARSQSQLDDRGYIRFIDAEDTSSLDCDSDRSENSNVSTNAICGDESMNLSEFKMGKKRGSQTIVTRLVSNAERNEISRFLRREMDKVQIFYLKRVQRLSQQLEMFVHNKTVWVDTTGLLVPGDDTGLSDEILELYSFCVINIVAAKQILIRYDAFARTFKGTPMLSYFLKQVSHPQSSFQRVEEHTELQAVADSYEKSMPHDSPLLINFQEQRKMFQEILESSKWATSAASTDHENLTVTNIRKAKNWFLLGVSEEIMGLEPAFLTMRGKSLVGEMKRMAEWRKNKHNIKRPTRAGEKLTSMQRFHLTLNLLSGFLYCMNYYIIEPSSTMYANRLGAYDAMSGTLIGMMPLAAFLSSIPYSIWSNKSFRHPFIMSGFLLMIGNFIYSFADQFQMIWIALLGRFISGLGAPKCIIRRYMADTTTLSVRTSVNAGFGMVVAAGSAMGPAMAVLLNEFEYTFAAPVIGIVTLNGLTLPGYFMSCMWFFFTLVVLLTFEEPDRLGLKEQKMLELQGAISGTPASSLLRSPSGYSGNGTETSCSSQCDRYELKRVFSGESFRTECSFDQRDIPNDAMRGQQEDKNLPKWRKVFDLINLPTLLCLGLLLAKVFVIEALVSATSALSKNRYNWRVAQVGTLGFINGILIVPFSILIGKLSMSYQDRILMKGLVIIGCFGLFLLIDLSDLITTPTSDYNMGNFLAVNPQRYILGYSLSYLSIQSFEGVIGSCLSKVIPTALASGTFNSGLLATLVDTFGRACGDLFISLVGFVNLRQLMNLLFIPGFCIMLTCLTVIERYRDMLSV